MRKCPKCRKYQIVILTEVWTGHHIEFEVVNGVREEKGYLEDGEPFAVYAECACGNRWKLRGVSDIRQLDR